MAKPVPHYGKWRIRWTDELSQRHSEVFDNHRDAAFELKKRLTEVEEIWRGLRSTRMPDKSFSDLCDYWLNTRLPTKRSGAADRSSIKKHLRPAFGARLLQGITVAQTDEYQTMKSQLNRKTVANHLTLLISMLNVAVDLGWLSKAPKIKKPRIPIFTQDFRYLRTQAEITRFLAAAWNEGSHIHALYGAAIYSGMRAGELAGLRWDDIDFERR